MNIPTPPPETRTLRPFRAAAIRRTLTAAMMIGSMFVVSGCATTTPGDQTATNNSTSGLTATTQLASATAVTTLAELESATHFDAGDVEYDESQVTSVQLGKTTATTSGVNEQDVAISDDGNETIVTISGGGTYRLSGTLSGQVVVNSADEAAVQLIFDNAQIDSQVGSPLLITAADEVTVIVADGTTNSLSDAASRTSDDQDLNFDTNAALFSRTDLTLAGTGTLQITGNLEDGIHGKDGVVIAGPTLVVSAPDDGIIGKDYLAIADGDVDVTAQDTGIGSDNDEDADRGWLSIIGGAVTVSTNDDAIKAENAIAISGGLVTVTQSEEGIEAANISISGGTVDVTSKDDGINAAGGYGTETTTANSTTDGAAATSPSDQNQTDPQRPAPRTGEEEIPQRPSVGEESAAESPSGEIPGRGIGGNPGAMEEAGAQSITISGGQITVNAGGDGIDSNGSATISGGNLTVFGPENDGNGALDVTGEFEVVGGTLTAVGSAGMAQTPDASSAQASVSINLSSSIAAGTTVELTRATGEVLASIELVKLTANIVFSSPDIVAGETYELHTATSEQQDSSSGATLLGSANATGGQS